MISEKELQSRAEFFSKHLFGIKYRGNIFYVSKTVEDDYTGKEIKNPYLGSFCHNDDPWDLDLDTDDYGDCSQYDEYLEYIPAYANCDIEISDKLANDVLRLNDVLLHELIHFILWYQGLDYMDGQKQFEDTLKKYGITSNYGSVFNTVTKKWEYEIDTNQMQKYEDMYQDYIKKGN